MDAKMSDDGKKIQSVKGWQMTTQQFHTVEAKIFADCSGDSILAPLTGAACRWGREARGEFNEAFGPDEADRKTMGMTCMIQARETDKVQKFVAPEWAMKFPDESAFKCRGHELSGLQNFWYLELGGEQDTIRDTELLREELLKLAFGVWDHIKNHGDHGAEKWVLEWVGFLPGKRESRRYEGKYMMTERDITSGGKFDDLVAFGGWTMDDHPPKGFRNFG
ncbi:MAG: FAD-dependent oxidoreductase, partial [Victivallaceae bacterium]